MAEVPLAAALPGGATFHGRYRIVRGINAGGMGAVYDCVHVKTGKHRALKVMLPQVLTHAGMRERFELEARATADIDSDHIVETFDAGIDEESGAPFLVMELLRGKDLDVILREGGPLTPEEVVVLLSQAALALDKTHAASIVHRDLKPQNLFVTTRDDGSPCLKVLDFGIAKVVAESDKTKAQTATIGTPVYMSPEQILGQGTLGPRADLYALGHIAFTLLVGQPYWEEDWREAGSPFVLWSKVMAGAKEPPSHRAYRLGASLPSAFDAWFATATAHHAVSRFDRAATMIAALAEALGVARDRVSPTTLATLATRAFVPVERASRIDIVPPAGLSGALGGTPQPAITPPPQVTPPPYSGRPSDVGSVTPAAPPTPHTAPAVSRDASMPSPAPATSRAPLFAGALLLVGLLGAGGSWIALGARKPPDPTPAARSEAEVASTSAPVTIAVTTASPAPPQPPPVLPAPEPSAAVVAPSPPSTLAQAPSAPALPSPSPLKKTAPVPPPPQAPAKPNCNPPYQIDASGIRTRKPECR